MSEQPNGEEAKESICANIRDLAIAAAQIATIIVLAEHAGWHVSEKLAELRRKVLRWRREQEFEAFYRYVWPNRKGSG